MSDTTELVATPAAHDLLRKLNASGIKLTLEDGKLRAHAPPQKMTVELQAAIRAQKEQLIELLTEEASLEAEWNEGPDGVVPLAPAQQRLWLFQQLQSDAATFNLTPVIHIDGVLDVERLDRAMRSVLERHEPLRSVVATEVAVGAIRPLPAPDRVVQVLDYSHLSGEAQSIAVSQFIREQQTRVFDLTQDIPFRATVLRLGADAHLLVTTMHHIAVDGVSLEHFYRDLAAFYEGVGVAPLAATYRHYAAWQNRHWTPQRVAERVAFWREQLNGAPHLLDLPLDYRRTSNQSFAGGAVMLSIGSDMHQSIEELARTERSSLFMVMLAAFSAALHQHSGQRDLVVGTPLHGRDRAEYGDLVGMFVNQLPLRMQVGRGVTMRQLLRQARDTTLDCMTENEVPFGVLVDALGVPRDASRSPLFQVMLNVLPVVEGRRVLKAGGITFQLPEVNDLLAAFDGQSRYDATLYVVQKSDGLALVLNYNSDLFSEGRMQSLLDTVREVLHSGAASPDAPLGAEAPLGALHHDRSIAGPDPDVPEESVADRFTHTANKYADRPAIIGSESTVSYAELLRESRRTAQLIASHTERVELPIGVFVPHDPSLVPAILGALLAGRPYVPLDPSYPAERLSFMAADSGVNLILTTPELRTKAEQIAPQGSQVIVLNDEAPEITLPEVAPEQTAYLLYTSGSTGKPKAVVQNQGNLVRQADRYARALRITPADRLALLASISFDASLMDLFGALLSGAAICPIDPRETDLRQLPDILTDRSLSVIHMTPTLFRTVARVAEDPVFPTIRAVDLGGEAMRSDDVEFFDECFPSDAMLINSYGPSEHTFALGYAVPRGLRSQEVPIGKPIGDVEVILLDEDGNPDPVQGELALRSAYGALRYWNNPEATAAAFTIDADDPTKRIYRTGDIVRRRPDGNYVYLHRADSQLKIRGHRIEPNEIEEVLRRHPDIVEVGVHAPVDHAGDPVLTACYVARTGKEIRAQELAAHCTGYLPKAQVPTEWVRIEQLPRTPSGKVDRNSLPAAERGLSEAALVAARDAEEFEIQQIWAEVLGKSIPGVEDSFFDLGGHSLSATMVVARIRDVLGVELPLRHFFDHPTVAQTAAWVRANRENCAEIPPLRAYDSAIHGPLSFSQERLWFLQQMDLEATAYNMDVAALLEGPLDVGRLEHAFNRVAMRQPSMRTTFAVEQGRPRQIIAAEPTHAFHSWDFSDLPEEEAIELSRNRIHAVLRKPYDLESGPLCRIVVARIREDKHAVGIGTHHTISDMWSYGVLGKEISQAYSDALGDPMSVVYGDYALWQREWLQGAALEQQVQYWRNRLDGLTSLDFPTDFPRPPFVSFNGDKIEADLPATLRSRIQGLSAAHGATSFMTLLAAFNALLSAYARSEDIAVGVPIAGRRVTETRNLVGTFVNTLVHRNDLSGDPTFTDLIVRIRNTALDAFAHQDAPFELLVKELQPPRDPSRAPFFQVLFNVANVPVDTTGPNGVRQTNLSLPRTASQFDFNINVGLNEAVSNVSLTFNTALFTSETAQRLLNHYLEILERAVANPQQRLSELRTPPAADRKLLVEDWNATERPYPLEANLLTLLEQQVARNPHATAIDSPTGSFTYAQLLSYARGVTAELRKVGVQPGDRVAIVMSRGREMVGALLGILGSGAAYVPVDPNYPPARVRYMLEDSEASAIVSHQGLERPYEPQVPVVQLDDWQPRELAEFTALAPADAAYVIYTSGSTGLPKGVEISHGAMANFLLTMQETPGFTEHDRLLAVTTISFDIAVLELYLPLIAGGRVVMASEEEAMDGRRLIRLLDEAEITMMQATPATWKLMLAAGWTMSPRLRVLCGGEPLPRVLADDLLDRVDELWNMYGPTETTVWSTLDRIERDEPILVGRPIANTTVYVLRDDLSLCPIGVPGELYIGGRGVANGYVNRPELTAQQFIPDPFRPGERIYRTGDLVRFRSDGRLEHLGRLDNQVKVRGFRIELGEVESALQSHEAVRDAVVIAADDRLVGYVVQEPGASATSAELRSWVSGSLPPYMVPALVMTLDELPLTPNGKVDRKRLPAPTGVTAEPREVVLPSNPVERVIAEVWASLLGVEEIGAGDNFFELGGHSLLAMEAVALIEERTGYRPEPRTLFFMTLGEIAASVAEPVLDA